MGEDAVSAPGSGAGDAGEFGAVPAVAALEVVDASFGSGSPFDLVAECPSVFECAAGGAGFALAWDGHVAHPELVEIIFDRCVSAAPISGHCPWWASGAAADPFDGGCQLRCICGVSELDAVVQDDTVGVSTTWAL